jgi:hypothetical protein
MLHVINDNTNRPKSDVVMDLDCKVNNK